MDIGGRIVIISQLQSYLPMPVGEGTVTDPVPYPQDKPRTGNKPHRDKMGETRSFLYPAKENEKDQ